MTTSTEGLADKAKVLHIEEEPRTSASSSTNENGGALTPASTEPSSAEGDSKDSKTVTIPADQVGMECEHKNLYSGPEDKRGRYKWQETIPDDLGKPVEGAESAKYALIVRHVKVYNDPRKVLRMHSILVQSPLLKKFLGEVLKDYPGVTVNLQRLEFRDNFEPLVHRWPDFEAAIKVEKDDETRKHAQLLHKVLEDEFKDLIEESLDMRKNGVVTYEYLWTLFQPGHMIFARRDGQETVLKYLAGKYGKTREGLCVFWLTCQYVDWDGHRHGTAKLNLRIPVYEGTVSINKLSTYPMTFHNKVEDVRTRLIERGRFLETLAGVQYKGYKGYGWKLNQYGSKEKFPINGRVVLDTASWNRFEPNHNVFVTPFAYSSPGGGGAGHRDDADSDDYNDDDDYDSYNGDEYSDADEGDMPIDGEFVDDDEDAVLNKRPALTEEQSLMLNPVLRGYALREKLWLNFFVNCVKDVEFSTGAFESLVLPSKQKELVLGFIQSQQSEENRFDDIIIGKGRGIILLLCGPPGVGKTLTAESVAEEMRVPLYTMSAGDLGLDPRTVEQKLENVLDMCTRWKAILLIDEADIFLEQRSLHELERNKLVSIFLRVLEYYEGIMFLTTNRVETFDQAFQSRIHISLDYPELNVDSRRAVWRNFLYLKAPAATEPAKDGAVDKATATKTPEKAIQKKYKIDHEISDRDLDRLANIEINGRQIKNVLKTAQLLARKRGSKLRYEHVQTVLDVTQHLHMKTRASESARSAIFN